MNYNDFSNSIKETKYESRVNSQFNRLIDSIRIEQKDNVFTNERDLFNQNSNGNYENLDFSHFKVNDYELGMPLHNPTILRNKKSLLSKPLMQQENNIIPVENNNFTDEYYSIKTDNEEKNIEKGIVEYEYVYNINNKKSFFNINTPFSLSYVWKTLVLLSKYPTNQKLLDMLNIKNKNLILQSMKDNCDLFNQYSKINISIPLEYTINQDYINKLNNIFNINIFNKDHNLLINSNEEIIMINLETNYCLSLPSYYNPKIIVNNLINQQIKTKFIKLENVYSYVNFDNNEINIEIPLLNNTIIGFIYNNYKQNINEINYDKLLNDKPINTKINNFIFPKFTTNKFNDYGYKFNELLNDFHIGEIIYGKLFKLVINQCLDLNININSNNSINNIKNINNINLININHSNFFYIKENKKIIISGYFKI
jgi:hypothetical protein